MALASSTSRFGYAVLERHTGIELETPNGHPGASLFEILSSFVRSLLSLVFAISLIKGICIIALCLGSIAIFLYSSIFSISSARRFILSFHLSLFHIFFESYYQ